MYWHGCNYPWSTEAGVVFYGMDFGGTIWGSHVGVSVRREAIGRDFAAMARLGFTVARWFVFGDGRAGIVYDQAGLPLALDDWFFADLDAGLQIASAHGIRLVLVLLDHRWMFSGIPDAVTDPTTGTLFDVTLPDGRSHVLRRPEGREALVSRICEPIVRRYGRGGARADLGPCLLAWELMNEPDFVVEEWERDLSSRVTQPVRFADLGELAARFHALVHAHTDALTTMAAARMHNLWAWDDDALGVDVIQVHSYPDLKRPDRDADVFGRPAGSLGLSRPVVLGEFPGNGPARHPAGTYPPPTTLAHYLDFAVTAGYAGAWPWSYSGTDGYGRLPEAPLQAFAQRFPEWANTRSGAPGRGGTGAGPV